MEVLIAKKLSWQLWPGDADLWYSLCLQRSQLRVHLVSLTELLEPAPPSPISSSGSFPDVVYKEGLMSIIQNLRIIATGF